MDTVLVVIGSSTASSEFFEFVFYSTSENLLGMFTGSSKLHLIGLASTSPDFEELRFDRILDWRGGQESHTRWSKESHNVAAYTLRLPMLKYNPNMPPPPQGLSCGYSTKDS